MKMEFCLSDNLFRYILEHIESSPDTVFTEAELNCISRDSFQKLKKQKYLQYVQYDPEKEPYYSSGPGDSDNERFVRKINGQYYAYSSEDSDIDRIPLTKEDITRWSFNISTLLKEIKAKNRLSKGIDNISPRIFFIGDKKVVDKKVGVFLGLFADNKQAESELLSLKSKVSQFDIILVLCPFFIITSQSLLKKIEDQAIFCMCFNDVFKDNNFVIDGRIFQNLYLPDSELSRKRIHVKFPTPPGTRWEDVTIQVVSNDSIKITAKGVYKTFTYAEIGFKDKRKGDLWDSQWEVLMALAEENGEISWDCKNAQLRLQKKIQTIRRRLQALMGIEEDPFYCYQDVKAYKTKFKIEDISYRNHSKPS
jgi:hypothetical protein